MIRFFLILSVLFLNIESIWSEELTKQEIRFLNQIDKVDKKNEAFGETIPLETKHQILMPWFFDEPIAISEGLTLISASSEGSQLKAIYRAQVDISNYTKEEIMELQDVMLERIKLFSCSLPRNRRYIFTFNPLLKYEFIDIFNTPFGEELSFDKSHCKGIKTFGQPRRFTKSDLKKELAYLKEKELIEAKELPDQ